MVDSNSLLGEKTSISLILVLGLILFSNIALASDSGANMTEPEYDSQEDVYIVSNLTELNWIRKAPKEDYKLISDINATPTENWNDGKGWKPIGEENYEFYGELDGNDYEINNLTIIRSRFSDERIGFISITGENGLIENLQLRNVSVEGEQYTGGLVGANYGRIEDVEVSGTIIQSGYYTGGLVGRSYEGDIVRSRSSVNIISDSDEDEVGGLVGRHNGGRIINSSSTGNIRVDSTSVGGLVGTLSGGTVLKSNSSIEIKGKSEVGGLIGRIRSGIVEESYHSGKVEGDEEIGGLVGINTYRGEISNSYSTSKVTGNRSVGGLVGYNDGEISKSYSTGNVTGDTYEGGLIGWNVGTVESSFWNTQKSGLTESDGGTGLNTSEMKSYWNFADSYYFGPDEINYFGLKNNSEREIILENQSNSFELVGGNLSEDKGIINVNGQNKTLNSGENFSLSGQTVTLDDVGEYDDYAENSNGCSNDDGGGYSSTIIIGDPEGKPEEVTLRFNLDSNWCLHQSDSFEDINNSYTWNIVDGESYPFLTWEEKEEGNQSVTIEVEDDLGNSLEDASVRLDAEDKETDSSGEASFEDLYEAEYTAIANKNGYRENSTNFDLTQDGQTEKVVIEKIKSDFNITDISLNASRVDKGEEFSINVTVKNNGSETGRRNLDVVVDGETKEREVQLDSGESEILEFTASEDSEGDSIIYASIFDVTRNETISVGPRKYNLEVESSEGGSTSPEAGVYTYEEGEAVSVEADSNLGWKFQEWNGDTQKESDAITLTMDEDKVANPVFDGDRALEINNLSAPKTENGEVEFNFRIINNEDEQIRDQVTVKYNDRNISNLNREITLDSNQEYETGEDAGLQSFDLVNGDASQQSELEVNYGGESVSREFRVGSVEREFEEGWNYFSLPIVTDQTKPITEIFNNGNLETMWTYDDGEWKNYHPDAPDKQFDSIKGGQGYIIKANEQFKINPIIETNVSNLQTDSPVTPVGRDLESGWNLIGSYWNQPIDADNQGAYSSLSDGQITQTLYSQKDGSLNLNELDGEIEPGKAYWVSSKDVAVYTKSN